MNAPVTLFIALLLVPLQAADVPKPAPLTVAISAPPATGSGYFKLGATRSPRGHEISVNSSSLLFDGKPWSPVMGEFHYTRYPQAEWREELLKMKAGGVDIVSSYIFWNHHEEIEGQWDWSGSRDLRKFVKTCHEVGLKVLLRCGPFAHGEARYGGFPDWVLAHKEWDHPLNWLLRSSDPEFLSAVKRLYNEIGGQVKGQMWKDGGPLIGVQLDNEFGGPADYLLTLKSFAKESGIDVPFYTITGWIVLSSPLPDGEMLPLFGGYSDAFWDTSMSPLPNGIWEEFTFNYMLPKSNMGAKGEKEMQDGGISATKGVPFLTCETGGGMESSYHRRINLDPRDVESVAFCKLGSGSSLMGYYMYHGGQNPDGKLSTLNESHVTGTCDLPVKSYDFGAPLGQYGQIRPHYYWLRRMHLFIHDFCKTLSPTTTTLPGSHPEDEDDVDTLRWAVRSNGKSGYVFVNNYQRLQTMPAKANVQFTLQLTDRKLVIPHVPITIPADTFFFWPFNLNLGGARLLYATAQPVCKTGNRRRQTFYFAKTAGVGAEFAFDVQTLAGGSHAQTLFRNLKPGRGAAISLKSKLGTQVRIVLLSEADSLSLSKRIVGGRAVAVFETPPKPTISKVAVEMTQAAGLAREIPLINKIPTAPSDEDFKSAAIWKIKLPTDLDLKKNPILRIRYVGDVARVTLNGRCIDDNFYSGREFELGLKRYAPEILTGDLRLEILPLRKDSPIFLEAKARPDFGANETVLKLESMDVLSTPNH